MKLFHVNDDTWNRCKMTVKQIVNHFHRKNPIYTHAKYNKIQYSIMRHNKKCHVTKQKITRKNINKSINKLKMDLNAYGYLIFTFPVVTFSTKLSCPCAQISDIYNNIFRNI